jgi:hypothetical protein
MEPMKESSNVTRLPGAEDIRLREPPHNFEAEQALLGAILINNAAYQRVAEFLRPSTSPIPARQAVRFAVAADRARPGRERGHAENTTSRDTSSMPTSI